MDFAGLWVLEFDEELILGEGVADVHQLRVALHGEIHEHVLLGVIELVLGLDSLGLLPVERFEYLYWGFLLRLLLRLCRLVALRHCDPWGLYGPDLLDQRLPVGLLPGLQPDQLSTALHVLLADGLPLEPDLLDFLIRLASLVTRLLLVDLQELLSAAAHLIRDLCGVLFLLIFLCGLLLGGGGAVEGAREEGGAMALGQL